MLFTAGSGNVLDGFLLAVLQVVRTGRADVLTLHGGQESPHGAAGLLVRLN